MQSSGNEVEEFMENLEKYYGKYPDNDGVQILRNYVKRYVSKYEVKKYTTLLMKVYETHPLKFGPPDISAINKAHIEHLKFSDESLKQKNSSTEWKAEYLKPLTMAEKLTAKESHDNFLDTMKDLNLMKNIKTSEV